MLPVYLSGLEHQAHERLVEDLRDFRTSAHKHLQVQPAHNLLRAHVLHETDHDQQATKGCHNRPFIGHEQLIPGTFLGISESHLFKRTNSRPVIPYGSKCIRRCKTTHSDARSSHRWGSHNPPKMAASISRRSSNLRSSNSRRPFRGPVCN